MSTVLLLGPGLLVLVGLGVALLEQRARHRHRPRHRRGVGPRLAPGPAREAEVADRGPRAFADREGWAVNAGVQPERSRPRSISVVIPAFNAVASLARAPEALSARQYEDD